MTGIPDIEPFRRGGPAVVPDVVLTRKQVAQVLAISVDTLERIHDRHEGPPRFKISPRCWGYPVSTFQAWKAARLAAEVPC